LLAIGLVVLIAFLKISGGSAPPPATHKATVPNVIGLSRGEAEAAIRDRGLEIGDVLAVEGERDLIVRTDPPSGSQVAPGSTVTLYVGSPPKQKEHGKGEGNGNGQGEGDD
jgi:serine/threonine-protein kinase